VCTELIFLPGIWFAGKKENPQVLASIEFKQPSSNYHGCASENIMDNIDRVGYGEKIFFCNKFFDASSS
jgi:hypothetical protein